MTPKMSNIPPILSNQMINQSQTQQGPSQGFTDRNPRNGTDFNQEQGVPAINHFDEAKIVQVIQNQNIVPMRNVPKSRYLIVLF